MRTTNLHVRSPFKFLDSYEREDGAIFFGRKDEVETLYQFVNKNRLVLVYGQSGIGKTSVVQCGLANRFEVTDWLPFFIRRGKDINISLWQTLSQSKALGGMPVTVTNLLPALERISARYVRPIYLIFDQFEELLIMGNEEEKDQFINSIQNILRSEKTQAVNVLFVLREEYFAWLDVFESRIHGFSDRRLRIESMRPARLEGVIVNSCEAFNITLEDPRGNATRIIDNLRSKGGIPLPYLQVYLDMLWRAELARTYPNGWDGTLFPPLKFSSQRIGEFGVIKDVLDRFLKERIDTIQENLVSEFPEIGPDTVRKVLDTFATEESTKRPVGYRQEGGLIQLDNNAPIYLQQLPAKLLTACLKALEQSRLLRTDEETFELAHDTLAALIDQKRTDEERRLNEVRRQIRSSYQVYKQTGDYLTSRQLTVYEYLIPELALEENLLRFVEESRRYRKAEEQQQLEEEQQKRSRANLFAAIFFVLAILASAASVWALRSKKTTQNAYNAMSQAKDEADEEKKKAIEAQINENTQRNNAINALEKFRNEEAKRVSSYVDNILRRADKLKEKHPAVYQAMINDIKKELKNYPENPLLIEKLNKLNQ